MKKTRNITSRANYANEDGDVARYSRALFTFRFYWIKGALFYFIYKTGRINADVDATQKSA